MKYSAVNMVQLLRWVVLLVAQVALQGIRLNHLQVLHDQGSAVSLGVCAVVDLAFGQGVVGNAQLLVPYPLLLHHRGPGLLHLRQVLVVNVVERHQLGTLVVLVGRCMLVVV